MSDLEVFSDAIHSECVLALFLVNHPDTQVLQDDTYFVYDSAKGYFLSCKPSNKKLNGWYRARGMDSWLRQALKLEV